MNEVPTLTVERPILFTGEMVTAIQDGSKTQTRRVMKKVASAEAGYDERWFNNLQAGKPCEVWQHFYGFEKCDFHRCPYGSPGDELYVRELLRRRGCGDWFYASDQSPVMLPKGDPNVASMIAWAHHQDRDYCPSIHMPKWASRIKLRVLDIRVEHVQAISEEDAEAEGVKLMYDDPNRVDRRHPKYREGFHTLWDSINGKRDGGDFAWDKDPLVWVVEFERIENEA